MVSPVFATYVDTHKLIMNSDFAAALNSAEESDQRSVVLVAIAYKEYLNLLAESLILLSEDKSTEALCDSIVKEFTEIRDTYHILIAQIDKTISEDTWHFRFNPPLTVDNQLQDGAKAYSEYILNIASRKYPKTFSEIRSIILGYLPIVYQTRLIMVSVNPPAKEVLPKLLLEAKTYELDMDLSKIWYDLSK